MKKFLNLRQFGINDRKHVQTHQVHLCLIGLPDRMGVDKSRSGIDRIELLLLSVQAAPLKENPASPRKIVAARHQQDA
ncbi:hypothetical protein [Xanthomonas axonopodis]|uniref:hypothetical protein n=1 Tax=Xanthomonas axonopodis TaxID=53413 RepID=UPI003555E114